VTWRREGGCSERVVMSSGVVDRQSLPDSSITRRGWASLVSTRQWNTSRQSLFTPTAVWPTTDRAGSSTTSSSSPPKSSWDKWLRLRTLGCWRSLHITTVLKSWTTPAHTRCRGTGQDCRQTDRHATSAADVMTCTTIAWLELRQRNQTVARRQRCPLLVDCCREWFEVGRSDPEPDLQNILRFMLWLDDWFTKHLTIIVYKCGELCSDNAGDWGARNLYF